MLDAVLGCIRKEIETALDMEKLMNSRKHRATVSSEKNKLFAEIEQAKQRLVRVQRLRERLYDDYLEELLTERDYLYTQNRYSEQESALERDLEELLDRQNRLQETKTKENPWVKSFLNVGWEPELTAGLVAELVDSVTVNNDSTVEVLLRFRDEYEQLNACLPAREVAANE